MKNRGLFLFQLELNNTSLGSFAGNLPALSLRPQLKFGPDNYRDKS
jgi:hypothetical protein